MPESKTIAAMLNKINLGDFITIVEIINQTLIPRAIFGKNEILYFELNLGT